MSSSLEDIQKSLWKLENQLSHDDAALAEDVFAHDAKALHAKILTSLQRALKQKSNVDNLLIVLRDIIRDIPNTDDGSLADEQDTAPCRLPPLVTPLEKVLSSFHGEPIQVAARYLQLQRQCILSSKNLLQSVLASVKQIREAFVVATIVGQVVPPLKAIVDIRSTALRRFLATCKRSPEDYVVAKLALLTLEQFLANPLSEDFMSAAKRHSCTSCGKIGPGDLNILQVLSTRTSFYGNLNEWCPFKIMKVSDNERHGSLCELKCLHVAPYEGLTELGALKEEVAECFTQMALVPETSLVGMDDYFRWLEFLCSVWVDCKVAEKSVEDPRVDREVFLRAVAEVQSLDHLSALRRIWSQLGSLPAASQTFAKDLREPYLTNLSVLIRNSHAISRSPISEIWKITVKQWLEINRSGHCETRPTESQFFTDILPTELLKDRSNSEALIQVFTLTLSWCAPATVSKALYNHAATLAFSPSSQRTLIADFRPFRSAVIDSLIEGLDPYAEHVHTIEAAASLAARIALTKLPSHLVAPNAPPELQSLARETLATYLIKTQNIFAATNPTTFDMDRDLQDRACVSAVAIALLVEGGNTFGAAAESQLRAQLMPMCGEPAESLLQEAEMILTQFGAILGPLRPRACPIPDQPGDNVVTSRPLDTLTFPLMAVRRLTAKVPTRRVDHRPVNASWSILKKHEEGMPSSGVAGLAASIIGAWRS